VTSWLAHYGVFAVFGLMLIDAVFPAASELVMVYGGALASGALAHRVDVLGWHTSGLVAYLAVVVAGIAGYQLGAIFGWWIGKRGGRPFLEQHGRFFHLSPATLGRADRWFERWDDWAVFIGRITPVARSFISIPAGVFEMPFRRYNVFTLLGNALWCIVLAGAGWGLGASYTKLHHDFRFLEVVVVGGIVLIAAYLIVRRRRPGTMPTGNVDPPR
jgi:membrane protein DedA with SNARE-associated domain